MNLKNYDKLKNELNEYQQIIYGEHYSLISLMNNLSLIINKISSTSNDFTNLKNRYDQIKIEFDDIIATINKKSELFINSKVDLKDSTSSVGREEIKPTVSDKIILFL